MAEPARPTAYLVLDWNGTVVDDVDRAHAATQKALATAADPSPIHSVDDFRARFKLPLSRFLLEQGASECEVEGVVEVWNREMAAQPTALAPGARRLLSRAREVGASIHVVSGAQEETVLVDATALGVEPLLDSVTGSSHPKRHSVTAARTTPRPLIYVGDTEYDVAEARAAGAITVGTSYGYRPASALTAAGAHLIVDDLTSAIPLIEVLAATPVI